MFDVSGTYDFIVGGQKKFFIVGWSDYHFGFPPGFSRLWDFFREKDWVFSYEKPELSHILWMGWEVWLWKFHFLSFYEKVWVHVFSMMNNFHVLHTKFIVLLSHSSTMYITIWYKYVKIYYTGLFNKLPLHSKNFP